MKEETKTIYINDNSLFSIYNNENPNIEWVELDVLPNYYIGSNGKIYSKTRDKILKTQINCNHGYERVCLRYDGIIRNLRVHRLVAMAFLDDPENPEATEVDHINHCRCDNRVENLRWVTRQENMLNLKSNYKKHQCGRKPNNPPSFHANTRQKISVHLHQ
jgi:hypothetical protein